MPSPRAALTSAPPASRVRTAVASPFMAASASGESGAAADVSSMLTASAASAFTCNLFFMLTVPGLA